MNERQFQKLYQRIRNLHPADPGATDVLRMKLVQAWDENNDSALYEVEYTVDPVEAESQETDCLPAHS